MHMTPPRLRLPDRPASPTPAQARRRSRAALFAIPALLALLVLPACELSGRCAHGTSGPAARQRHRPAARARHGAGLRPAGNAGGDSDDGHGTGPDQRQQRAVQPLRGHVRVRLRVSAERLDQGQRPRRRHIACGDCQVHLQPPTGRPRASRSRRRSPRRCKKHTDNAAFATATEGGKTSKLYFTLHGGTGTTPPKGFWTDGHLQCTDSAGTPQALLVEPDFTTATPTPVSTRGWIAWYTTAGGWHWYGVNGENAGRWDTWTASVTGIQQFHPAGAVAPSRGRGAPSPSRPVRGSRRSASTRSSTGSAASPTTSGSTSTRARPARRRPAAGTCTARTEWRSDGRRALGWPHEAQRT